jgi:bacillopeptidase F
MTGQRIRTTLAPAGLTLLLAVGAAPAARAQVIEPDLDALLQSLPAGGEVSVIVTFVGRPDLAPFRGRGAPRGLLRAQLVQALRARAAASENAVGHLLAGPGVSRVTSLWAINGVAITAARQAIEALARHPSVERVRLDETVAAPDPAASTTAGTEWNLGLIGAPDLWAMGHTGAGVIVATMDTGVDAAHPDLSAQWRGGSNSWFDPSGQHATPYDRSGHGTQTMGLLVGGSAGGTAIGVAPDARWIAVKIFDDAGKATLSGIHQGFQWLLDPDGNLASNDAPDVVNNSWSLGNIGGCSLEFAPDLDALRAAGIAVVFAGGNYGPGSYTSVSPANDPGGFAVGAVDSGAGLMSQSSRGPSACDGTVYPEVVAPGVNVRTADLTFGGAYPDSYAWVSGTSYAAPHVAGGMALLLGAHPAATVADLEQALEETAVDLGPAGPDQDAGYGLVDLVAAESRLASVPPNLSPVAYDDAAATRKNRSLVGFSVVANDVDPDGEIDPATVMITSGGTTAAGGTVVAGGDGTVTYTPKKNFQGTDAFTYTVRDDDGATSNVATVQVTVR